MQRLAKAEQSLKLSQDSNREKEKRIRILEEKCHIMERARGYGNEQISELERKCQKLQGQVHSMEKFLDDYGMVWVGDEDNGDEEAPVHSRVNNYDELQLDEEEEVQSGRGSIWHPGSSLATSAPFKVNFDLIVKNIEELNSLAGEGEHVIAHTSKGARLKIRDPLPLTLYANGIFMFNGPFRPFSDAETQACVQDLMDGFFPSELQLRYPDGVPFLLKDLRETHFRNDRQEKIFSGAGQTLVDDNTNGRETTSDKEIQTGDERDVKETYQPPGVQKQTMEQFLNKLPSSVVRNGKLVDIKSDLKATLKGDQEKGPETVIVENELQQNETSSVKDKDSQAENITTLRIKSEKGDKTYILKMKYTDTIGDVKRQLNKTRHHISLIYQLKSTFPNRTYNNDRETLDDCGLVPNATLHMHLRK
eukprot:gene17734-9401_t